MWNAFRLYFHLVISVSFMFTLIPLFMFDRFDVESSGLESHSLIGGNHEVNQLFKVQFTSCPVFNFS